MWKIQLVIFVVDRGSLKWLLTSFRGIAFAKDVVIGGIFGKSGIAIKSFFGFDSFEVMTGTSEVEGELLADGNLTIVKDEGGGRMRGGLIQLRTLLHFC